MTKETGISQSGPQVDRLHMTSLEIARTTGKNHKDVMRAIRNMEPAWEKTTGRKFALSTYQDSTGRTLPCYSLTKTETLYVATKFNDEARARLVLRWKELEEERLVRERTERQQPMTDMEILSRAVLISREQVARLEERVAELEPKAAYCDEVLEAVSCLTTTQVAKELGMTAIELNSRLCERGVQYRQSGQYMLYAPFARRGYAMNRSHSYRDIDGEVHTRVYLVWTERGRRFIHGLFSQPLLEFL